MTRLDRLELDEIPDEYHSIGLTVDFLITLANEGSLTQKQLATETLMPRRTVRNALDQLTDAGLVTVQSCRYDARKRVYQVTPGGRESEL